MTPVELPEETVAKMLGSIRRYFADQLDEEVGELQAKLLFDFVMQEIASAISTAPASFPSSATGSNGADPASERAQFSIL